MPLVRRYAAADVDADMPPLLIIAAMPSLISIAAEAMMPLRSRSLHRYRRTDYHWPLPPRPLR